MKNYSQYLNSIPKIEWTLTHCNIENRNIYCTIENSKSEVQSTIEISNKAFKVIEEIQKKWDFFKYLNDANTINKTKRWDWTFIWTFDSVWDNFKNLWIVLPKWWMILPSINSDIIIGLLEEIKESKEKFKKLRQKISNSINIIIRAYNKNLSVVYNFYWDWYTYIILNWIRISKKHKIENINEAIKMVNNFIESDKKTLKCRKENLHIITSLCEKLWEKFYYYIKAIHQANFEWWITEKFDSSIAIEFEWNIYKWTDKDIEKLKIDIKLFFENRQKRLDYIFELYKKSDWKFETKDESAHCWTSMSSWKARYDEWTDFFLIWEDWSRVQISDGIFNEVEYLRSRLWELENQDWYFRNLNTWNQEKVPEILDIEERVIIYWPEGNRRRWEYNIQQLYNWDIMGSSIYKPSWRREPFYSWEYNWKRIDSIYHISNIIKTIQSLSNSFKIALKSTYPELSIYDAYNKYSEENKWWYIKWLAKYIKDLNFSDNTNSDKTTKNTDNWDKNKEKTNKDNSTNNKPTESSLDALVNKYK